MPVFFSHLELEFRNAGQYEYGRSVMKFRAPLGLILHRSFTLHGLKTCFFKCLAIRHRRCLNSKCSYTYAS
ncbi:uncharacterized [Tachysurus ichikawai]